MLKSDIILGMEFWDEESNCSKNTTLKKEKPNKTHMIDLHSTSRITASNEGHFYQKAINYE